MSGNTGSALDCLSEIARLRGVDISADRLRHDYVVEDAEPSLPLLLRMAQDIGLKARRIQCGWAQLEKLGAALPVMARLRNGNWVMIVEAGRTQRSELGAALELVRACPNTILVLNKVRLTHRHSFGSYYYFGYPS